MLQIVYLTYSLILTGSGCGLGGFAFALRGAHVTLTDVDEVMYLLQANLVANFGADEIQQRQMKVVPFYWGTDPPAAGLSPPYDWIIGADIVYKVRAIP